MLFEADQPVPKATPSQQNKTRQQPQSQYKKVLEQIDGLLGELTIGGTMDLIGATVNSGTMRVVITIDQAFLSDQSMSDLVDGEYTVLGKVTRVIPTQSNEKINLLRKTSLGRVQTELMGQFAGSLSQLQQGGLNIPQVVTELGGPLVQVLPIGIFV